MDHVWRNQDYVPRGKVLDLSPAVRLLGVVPVQGSFHVWLYGHVHKEEGVIFLIREIVGSDVLFLHG